VTRSVPGTAYVAYIQNLPLVAAKVHAPDRREGIG
jgi:hypothetical protein